MICMLFPIFICYVVLVSVVRGACQPWCRLQQTTLTCKRTSPVILTHCQRLHPNIEELVLLWNEDTTFSSLSSFKALKKVTVKEKEDMKNDNFSSYLLVDTMAELKVWRGLLKDRCCLSKSDILKNLLSEDDMHSLKTSCHFQTSCHHHIHKRSDFTGVMNQQLRDVNEQSKKATTHTQSTQTLGKNLGRNNNKWYLYRIFFALVFCIFIFSLIICVYLLFDYLIKSFKEKQNSKSLLDDETDKTLGRKGNQAFVDVTKNHHYSDNHSNKLQHNSSSPLKFSSMAESNNMRNSFELPMVHSNEQFLNFKDDDEIRALVNESSRIFEFSERGINTASPLPQRTPAVRDATLVSRLGKFYSTSRQTHNTNLIQQLNFPNNNNSSTFQQLNNFKQFCPFKTLNTNNNYSSTSRVNDNSRNIFSDTTGDNNHDTDSDKELEEVFINYLKSLT